MRHKIAKLITRYYSDNKQHSAIVEWSDGATTTGAAYLYHGLALPAGEHMGALFDRGIREGLTVERQVW